MTTLRDLLRRRSDELVTRAVVALIAKDEQLRAGTDKARRPLVLRALARIAMGIAGTVADLADLLEGGP